MLILKVLLLILRLRVRSINSTSHRLVNFCEQSLLTPNTSNQAKLGLLELEDVDEPREGEDDPDLVVEAPDVEMSTLSLHMLQKGKKDAQTGR